MARLPFPTFTSLRKRRRWRTAMALTLGVALALAVPMAASAAKAPAATPAPGAASIGDKYFPDTGNGGYDVQHYGLNVGYQPNTDVLTGTAIITAKTTAALSSFTLDLDGLTVQAVTVNGIKAKWTRTAGKLRITPKTSLRSGGTFIATVRYTGVPQSVQDARGTSGLLATDDGSILAGGPLVASTWFPVNDHPSDKALYSVRLTVPKGVEAVSNGRLLWQRDTGTSSIWFWDTDAPMPSHLATAAIGQFDIDAYEVDGIRYWDAIDSDLLTPALAPHTGSALAYSGQSNYSYKRLARTLSVPADDTSFSFWINRDIEESYDFGFVEILPADGVWRTLPDEGGILRQDSGSAGCENLLQIHPFLENYMDFVTFAPCAPTRFWAADGASDGWEQWSFDLSEYAGQDVYVSITYTSDQMVQNGGVYIDDIVAPGGVGSTSFEDDGDVMDGWTIPGPPDGSFGNDDDWTIGAGGGLGSPGAEASASLARQPEMVSFLAESFGPYPFDELGGIVTAADGLGFAYEGQTRPVYPAQPFSSQTLGDAVVVHEIAHQWFGASVTPARWNDVWLNEGFATYAEWLWSGFQSTGTPDNYFDNLYAFGSDEFWQVRIGDPGPDGLFDATISERGAMTLHALRGTIGDDVFFELLRTWTTEHSGGTVTTPEFIALAEKLSGQELDAFFEAWLFTPERPADVPGTGQRRASAESTQKLISTHDLRN